jgi:hypothetical protein
LQDNLNTSYQVFACYIAYKSCKTHYMLTNYKIPLSQYFNHPTFQLKGCPAIFPALINKYNLVTINGKKYQVPWKAVPASGTDNVYVNLSPFKNNPLVTTLQVTDAKKIYIKQLVQPCLPFG